jgi:hypothetical protein
MQTPKEPETKQNSQNRQTKPKKKEGKIQQVWEMSQKGISVKETAKKTGLKEQVVRSYIWRKQFPDKYKALLERYLAKRKKNGEKTKQSPKEEKPNSPVKA